MQHCLEASAKFKLSQSWTELEHWMNYATLNAQS